MESVVVPALFMLLIESVVFYVDRLAVQGNFDWRLVASLVVSILAAAGFGVDAFAEAGFVSSIPFLGAVFTGIVFSRGANVVHGVAGKLNANAT